MDYYINAWEFGSEDFISIEEDHAKLISNGDEVEFSYKSAEDGKCHFNVSGIVLRKKFVFENDPYDSEDIEAELMYIVLEVIPIK